LRFAAKDIPDNNFRPQTGFTLIHLGQDPGVGFELYAYVSPTDARKIPFAFSGDRYFYCVRSESDPTLATGGGLFDLPIPTRWLAVFSNDPAELDPVAYVLNHTEADESMRDQERLRNEVWKPWSRLQQPYARVYADAPNLPAEAGLTPPTLLGGGAPVLAELARTPHLVAMSGHGKPLDAAVHVDAGGKELFQHRAHQPGQRGHRHRQPARPRAGDRPRRARPPAAARQPVVRRGRGTPGSAVGVGPGC
jgi:hypothetical protein